MTCAAVSEKVQTMIRLASKFDLSPAFGRGDSRLALVLVRESAFRSMTSAAVSEKVQTVMRQASKIDLSPTVWRGDLRLA